MRSHRQLLAALITVAMATSLVSCNSKSTSSVTSPTDTIDMSPPQAPSDLHQINDPAFNRSWLVWAPSASASVSGYQIFSSPTDSGNGTIVATLGATTTSYQLPPTSVNGMDFYRVRAVGTNNVPSAFTASLSVAAWDGTHPTSGPEPGKEGDF